jgi:hypothetical protein
MFSDNFSFVMSLGEQNRNKKVNVLSLYTLRRQMVGGVAVLILNFGVETSGWPHNPITLSPRKEVMVPIQ